jgi:hypothetical protein
MPIAPNDISGLLGGEFGNQVQTAKNYADEIKAARRASKKKKVEEAVDEVKQEVKKKGKEATHEGIIHALSGFADKHPHLSGGLATAGSIAAWTLGPMLLDKLLHGRDEEQMLQGGGAYPDVGAGGDMGGVSGAQPDMSDLLEQKAMLTRMRDLGRSSNYLEHSLAHPSGNNVELANLLAGDEARLAQLQSPRRITPYEIMSAIHG